MTQRVWKSGQWNTVGDQYSDVVFYSSAPPPNPKIGDFWYDDTVGIKSLKIWNGLDWIVVSNAIYNSTEPSVKTLGQLWFDSVSQALSIWSGTAWIEIGKKSDDANNILANQVFR